MLNGSPFFFPYDSASGFSLLSDTRYRHCLSRLFVRVMIDEEIQLAVMAGFYAG